MEADCIFNEIFPIKLSSSLLSSCHNPPRESFFERQKTKTKKGEKPEIKSQTQAQKKSKQQCYRVTLEQVERFFFFTAGFVNLFLVQNLNKQL
jgi:hypothetical protein